MPVGNGSWTDYTCVTLTAEIDATTERPAKGTRVCGCAPHPSGQLVACTRHCLVVEGALRPARSYPFEEPGRCDPGDCARKGHSVTELFRRPPLQLPKVVRPEVAEEVLTKKLVNFVSVKGEDLLLQADSENQVKFHRLRSSVPGRLWKWKTVCGWPWKHQGYHINVLEVQAVHTCLQWKICRKRQQQCRFLHLTDSLVALHALSRGRSSSRKLRSILSQVNSLLLAADVQRMWGYASTKQNPADRPSRRPVIKRWSKKLGT